METERLQKLLAAAGFGSRRACEDMILDGRVKVNGHVVNKMPVLVTPGTDRIWVDGKPVRIEKPVYFLLNKPKNVFCTHSDPGGRTRAVDLLKGVRERVFPVGRLDADTMGLLVLTNDGELTQRLTHPSFSVPKTYRAEVDGVPSAETFEKLRTGVWLSEGRSSAVRLKVIHRQRGRTIIELTLLEGRNRQVRRMLAKLGHKVRRLTRIRMGKLSIARLPLGAFRPLTPIEVKHLRKLADGSTAEPDDAPRRKSASPRSKALARDTAPRRKAAAPTAKKQPPKRDAARPSTKDQPPKRGARRQVAADQPSKRGARRKFVKDQPPKRAAGRPSAAGKVPKAAIRKTGKKAGATGAKRRTRRIILPE